MALGRHSAAWDISLWARRADAAEEVARVLPHCAVSTNLSEVVESCDLAVLCTSPHAIATAGPELKKLLPPSLKSGALPGITRRIILGSAKNAGVIVNRST
jgi:predicted dinucleotide-utilizing enzyme